MARDKKECCYNCRYFSRLWNFCGHPKSTACKNAERVFELGWCVYWKAEEEDGK